MGWGYKALLVLNAPITLWLLSAIGVGIFSSAYSGRTTCLADAKQVEADYQASVLEMSSRFGALRPVVSFTSPADAQSFLVNPPKASASNQFKELTTYDVLTKLLAARDQIRFPPDLRDLTKPIDVSGYPALQGLPEMKLMSSALNYDKSLQPGEALGTAVAVASSPPPIPDVSTLKFVQTALLDAVIVNVNEALRLQEIEMRPNCSYPTIVKQLYSDKPDAIVVAVKRDILD
jgi:hypothetical protein